VSALADAAAQSDLTTVLLALVNLVQVVLLAFIASRGTRRRRSDRP
jgi:hypothetical protein